MLGGGHKGAKRLRKPREVVRELEGDRLRGQHGSSPGPGGTSPGPGEASGWSETQLTVRGKGGKWYKALTTQAVVRNILPLEASTQPHT